MYDSGTVIFLHIEFQKRSYKKEVQYEVRTVGSKFRTNMPYGPSRPWFKAMIRHMTTVLLRDDPDSVISPGMRYDTPVNL